MKTVGGLPSELNGGMQKPSDDIENCVSRNLVREGGDTMVLTVEIFLALLSFGALCFSIGYNLGKSEHKK